MTQGMTPGLIHQESMVVADRHTVPHVTPDWAGFADMPPVLATAMMVGFIENTCILALRPHLAPGQCSLGIHVDISHVAATLAGATITAQVELIAVEGRRLEFQVACHDDVGLIGEGRHRRAIIDTQRFMERLEQNRATR
ncbi:MAG: thioesterase [Novosphingobium sp. SCN 63-17]|uniref:thioesterase family protein n=2 Tax=Novosphingobium TaxID=165696 RepID=UPI00086C303E|nr:MULTISPECIES: thioesterase family protein [unclassified Novosphingobium]ODU82870.1 MAG: thioesterase [Novosphingobium sp. SCN 63-17]OJX96572.1 MAG: thioesterase [Novosphingobium sp. 63-713]